MVGADEDVSGRRRTDHRGTVRRTTSCGRGPRRSPRRPSAARPTTCSRSAACPRTSSRPDGVVQAVDDVSFDVGYGETLGLVGESGCGKSVSALSIARLVPDPPGKIVAGSILFDGIDLLKLSTEDMRKLRGKEIGFIFQDPLTSLNPTLTIGYQIGESIKEHMGLSSKAAKERIVELLAKVGIPRPADRLNDYPFQFSGGMRQRVMIAIALVVRPEADPRRRADDRARRDDPGPDPGAHPAAVVRVRDGRPDDHPRPRDRRRHVRPGQRHVRRPDRRDRHRRHAVREPAHAVRLGPARLAAAHRRHPRRAAADDRGHAAAADPAARRRAASPLAATTPATSAARASRS